MIPAPLIPLLQTLVEKLLGWPVATAVLFIFFRKPLSSLLRRLVTFKWKSVGVEGEISTSGEATEQLEATSVEPKDPLGLLGPSAQMSLPVPEEIAKRQAQVRAWGGEAPMLLDQIEALKQELSDSQFELNTPDTTEVLIRHLAATQIIQRIETIYRLIFGSQIAALRKLESDGPSAAETLKALYERAKKRSPLYFAQFSFDDWLNFLSVNQLITNAENEKKVITRFGIEFLSFMKSVNAPRKSH